MLDAIKATLVEDLKIKDKSIVESELDELSKLVYERAQLVKEIHQHGKSLVKVIKYNKLHKKITNLIGKINEKL